MRRLLLCALLLSLVAAACGGAGDPEPEAEGGTVEATAGEVRVAASATGAAADPADVAAVADAVNAFGFDLLARAGDDDVVLSPLSVYTALAMLRAGADGQTAAEIDAVLGRDGTDEATWHAAVGALRGAVATAPTDEEVSAEDGDAFEVALADSAWVQTGYGLREAFLRTLADAYDVGIHAADFAGDPDGAVDLVNRWVADATRGRIPRLFEQFDPATVLALVDAITFTASWTEAFDDAATDDRPFTLADGSVVDVATMATRRHLAHTVFAGADVVRLPYVGDRASMLVVVPEAGGLAEVEAALDADALADVRDGLDEVEVDLWLPRFEIRQRLDLAPMLQDLGMTDAFTASADLSRIAGRPGDLLVDQAVHEAWIDVSEAGTEAAAATGIAVSLTAVPDEPEEVVEVHADRPFLYLIVEEATGAVLFAGRVTDPR